MLMLRAAPAAAAALPLLPRPSVLLLLLLVGRLLLLPLLPPIPLVATMASNPLEDHARGAQQSAALLQEPQLGQQAPDRWLHRCVL